MDDVQITLSFPPDVSAHILDVLASAFPSDEPRTPAELCELAVRHTVLVQWLSSPVDDDGIVLSEPALSRWQSEQGRYGGESVEMDGSG